MIKTLNIYKTASYKNPVRINLDGKKLALFYGLNGSGKSSITNYLLAYSKGDPLPSKYSSCSVEWDSTGEKEIVVYNSQFVTSVFYENKEQKGVFSLGDKNVEAEKKIEFDRGEIEKRQPLFEVESQAAKNSQQKLDDSFSKIKDKVFKVKQNFEKKELDFCLKGFKTKDEFWKKLNSIIPESSEKVIDIEELKNRARLIENPPEPKKKFNPVTTKFVDIEKDDLWNECIIGTGDSYLKGLIDSLGNMDWFRYGYASYFEKSSGKCPFCQQVLPNDFKEECEKIFDLEYKNKLQRLEGLFERYEHSYHYSITFDESQVDNSELKKAIELFRNTYEKNKNAINEKRRNPSVTIKLDSLDEKVAAINEIINTINEEADVFNSRLGNPQKERNDILGLFWKWVEKQYHDDIIQYKQYSKRLNEEMNAHASNAESYQ